MKKLASILAAALLMTMLVVPALAAPGDDVPSVEREEPVVVIGDVDDLPDPNLPDAPDFVVIQDPEEPENTENFVRVPDPEDPETSDSVYLPENQLPLDNPDDTTKAPEKAPEKKSEGTGTHAHLRDLCCWIILIVSALVGLVLGFIIGRATKKNDDDEEEAKKTDGDTNAQ